MLQEKKNARIGEGITAVAMHFAILLLTILFGDSHLLRHHNVNSKAVIECPFPSQTNVETDELNKVIYSILMPLVCMIGSIGASISLFIFTRRQMRSSLSIYLAALSLFDLVLLLMSMIIYPSMNLCVQEGDHGEICHFFWRSSLATYPISVMAQTCSVWTCVAITVDRFLAVQYPLHMRAWCNPKTAKTVVFCIGVVGVLYKMPTIFELTLDHCGRLRATQLRNHPLYIVIYNTYGYLLLLLVIPFLMIIVLNIIVVNAVHQANIRRRQMRLVQRRRSGASYTGRNSFPHPFRGSNAGNTTPGSVPTVSGGVSNGNGSANQGNTVVEIDSRCTKMATVTISAFLLFNWLAGMNNVIEAFELSVPGNAYRIPIGNLLVCLNSATNFLIYSIFGRRFRKLCAKLLCPCWSRKYENFTRVSTTMI